MERLFKYKDLKKDVIRSLSGMWEWFLVITFLVNEIKRLQEGRGLFAINFFLRYIKINKR